MTIYVSHSTVFDYLNNLYIPIRRSELNTKYNFILPHETTSEQYETKELFLSGNCALVIAECSYLSTGQGIELGWAEYLKIPVIGIFKKGKKPSGAMYAVTNNLVEYEDNNDLMKKVSEFLVKFPQVE